MVFQLFTGKKIDVFAKQIASDLAKRFPPSSEEGESRKISPKGLSNILESMYVKACTFKEEHKLGVYKVARLSNTFKWELKELGYSAQFIDVATEGLIVYLTRKTSSIEKQEGEKK